jgi:hypothetical protein
LNARLANAVIDNADRFCDCYRAVTGRIQHVYFAARCGLRDRLGECPAGQGERAGIRVEPLSGNPRAGRQRVGRRNGEAEIGKYSDNYKQTFKRACSFDEIPLAAVTEATDFFSLASLASHRRSHIRVRFRWRGNSKSCACV